MSENQLLPDCLIRFGIRHLLKKRVASLVSQDTEINHRHKMNFIEAMNKETIALVPELANEQHYEVPPSFFKYCLISSLPVSMVGKNFSLLGLGFIEI